MSDQSEEVRKPRNRLQILQDEIFEAQENLTFLFIQRDVALALDDKTELEKFNEYIKSVGRRKNIMLQFLKTAEDKANGIEYTEFHASMYIRNITFYDTEDSQEMR